MFCALIVMLGAAAALYLNYSDNINQVFLNLTKAQVKEDVQVQDERTKIERKVFGQSTQGKAIEGYEIGTGAKSLLLFGAIHGNEMGTADLMNQLMLEIALDPDLVSKNKKLIIIPVLNPDGYKDRTDNLNANGVNLNLNFGTSDWKEYGPEGNYAGSAPFSESESRVIKELVEKYKPEAMISFHSHGNLVSPEAGDASVNLAKWYSGKTGYAYFDAWDYPGTSTKWFVEATGKPAITLEISKDFQSDWEINKGALLELVSSDNWPFDPVK